jgi:hypothetical protein
VAAPPLDSPCYRPGNLSRGQQNTPKVLKRKKGTETQKNKFIRKKMGAQNIVKEIFLKINKAF